MVRLLWKVGGDKPCDYTSLTKEVLSIVVGENESSKYWLSVLNRLKNRGVQDILILCSDGLTGIKDAISTAFPKTEQQRCIVHMVRNTLKYVANKGAHLLTHSNDASKNIV